MKEEKKDFPEIPGANMQKDWGNDQGKREREKDRIRESERIKKLILGNEGKRKKREIRRARKRERKSESCVEKKRVFRFKAVTTTATTK